MTQPLPVKNPAETTGTRRRLSARRLVCAALAIALFGADALARDSAGLESGGGLAATIHGETKLPATFFQLRSFRSFLAIDQSKRLLRQNLVRPDAELTTDAFRDRRPAVISTWRRQGDAPGARA